MHVKGVIAMPQFKSQQQGKNQVLCYLLDRQLKQKGSERMSEVTLGN